MPRRRMPLRVSVANIPTSPISFTRRPWPNRAARKLAHFRHTADASPDAQTIKLADIIDNTRAIVQLDPNFARVYLVEKQVQIQLLSQGNRALWQQADHIIAQGIRQLAQPPNSVPESWFVKQAAKYGGLS